MNNVTIQRPWGWQTTVSKKTDCEVNDVTVRSHCSTEMSRRPKHKTSLVVVAGDGQIETPSEVIHLVEHQHYLLPENEWFKITNNSNGNYRLIEILYNV